MHSLRDSVRNRVSTNPESVIHNPETSLVASGRQAQSVTREGFSTAWLIQANPADVEEPITHLPAWANTGLMDLEAAGEKRQHVGTGHRWRCTSPSCGNGVAWNGDPVCPWCGSGDHIRDYSGLVVSADAARRFPTSMGARS